MQADIVRLTVRQLLSRGRLLALAGVVALPPFLAALYAASDSPAAPERFVARLCDGLVLTTVLPLLALVFAGAALGNEVEDGTLAYLLMKPVNRAGIVLAKLAPTVVIVAALTVSSVLLATVLAGRDGTTLRVGLAFAAAAAAGALAYCTLFLYVGLITSRTLVIGLVYIFLWEGALTGLFEGLRALSIRAYAGGVAGALADLPANVLDVSTSAVTAVVGLVLVVVLCFALAARRLVTMDVE